VNFKVVIPARLGSTRLPRKVLRPLAGKPLVQWVWQAAQATGAQQVVVATDDAQVLDACRAFGADARLTAASHQSGTDRVNEIAGQAGWSDDTLVVNLQGDEPLMPPALIRQAASLLAGDAQADIATLCHPLHAREEWLNPNVVKLVCDAQGYALYFSRAPIPWRRASAAPPPADVPLPSGGEGGTARGAGGGVRAIAAEDSFPTGLAFRHIGLYAYRVGALRRFSALPPSPLESCEMLEQLRALSHGLRIKVGISETPPPRGVDTEDDLAAVSALLAAR
jgi:3-deoxy-manno-octulosonate cytidylyltransferase (CMP-KDO synthetase)